LALRDTRGGDDCQEPRRRAGIVTCLPLFDLAGALGK
jgi:hypothetical protein